VAPEPASGFASRSNPSWLARRLQSRIVRRLCDPARSAARRRRADAKRRAAGEPLCIDFFHQVDDPYSHLAVQALPLLLRHYEIELVPRLAGPPDASNAPEAELLARYARDDSARVAPHYGLDFPATARPPSEDAIVLAQRMLAGLTPSEFPERAIAVGEALWGDDKAGLESLAQAGPLAAVADAQRCVAEGTALRAKLGHYSGGMFHYAGEWYWGVDRLHHLERHLGELGVARSPGVLQFARPALAQVSGAGAWKLEYFPSLRSPYTAIGFDRTVAFAKQSGIDLELRPVLPMVMRGVPATFAKGRYIFSDTWREGDFEGAAFGNFVDPIGRPVERAYSLFAWAREQGRATELLSCFLRLAWSEGVDTSRDGGLRRVVEAAGLSWADAQGPLDSEAWRDELEANRLAMYDEGLWGVPSYRISGPEGETQLACWGQDRLWLVSHEVARLLA
jgi:2-hydroxychromene-2-carboxylate isomerase